MTALDACFRARAAWQRQDQQQQLDLEPAVLSGVEPSPCRGPDGAGAYAPLTAASAARAGLGGTVPGASTPCSQTQSEEG